MDYKGYTILSTEEEINDFYQGNYDAGALKENEYLILKGAEGAVDYYCKHKNKLEKVKFPILNNKFEGKIKPRNSQQYCAMDLLLDPSSKIKLIRGVYGSGKDYLMLHSALHLLEKGKFDKIVFVRPHVGVAGLPDIGALPGTAMEKLAWTLAPLYDKVGGEEGVNLLLSRNQLEMVPMNFIRGRSFNNSIVYMTEGQNITTELAKLLIGRIGEGSELWINADNHQVDKKIFEQDNGIRAMVDKLSGHELFGYVYLPITERSVTARLSDLLDEI